MARPTVVSRSARGSEQQIQSKLDKAYQDYCAIRNVLEEMKVGEAVLGPRVEEPKRRCGRAGPWRIKTLAELEEEIGVMARLRAAVLFGWNSRENIMQIQSQQQQQPPHPTATRSDRPSLSTPPPSAGTTPTSTLETDDARAAAASLQMLQQIGRHRQYHNQQEQQGYLLGDAESQPGGAGPAVATTTDPDELGESPTQYQQQQHQGGVAQLCEGPRMTMDDVHQPTTDTTASSSSEQALPTSMAYQQSQTGMSPTPVNGFQQEAEDGLSRDFWDSSNPQEQQQAGYVSMEELRRWEEIMRFEEIFSMDWSVAPEEDLEDS